MSVAIVETMSSSFGWKKREEGGGWRVRLDIAKIEFILAASIPAIFGVSEF